VEYKELSLKNGMIAIVDSEDFDFLNQWTWTARKATHKHYYAQRKRWVNGKKKYIKMHRLIMNAPDDMIVDHINRNTLDCRKSNMRLCTIAQNNCNRKASGKSKYLGVTIRNGKPIAQITHNNKVYYLGTFKSEKDAAIAYNKAALEYHGEFANLNAAE
jgi:hypothetical protein